MSATLLMEGAEPNIYNRFYHQQAVEGMFKWRKKDVLTVEPCVQLQLPTPIK